MDKLAEWIDAQHEAERLDEAEAEGYDRGYAQARADVLALLAGQAKAKATAARKVAAVRTWAEAES